jgi:outer membrane protein
MRTLRAFAVTASLLLGALPGMLPAAGAQAEPLTFRRAIELAQRNSSTVTAAEAEQARARSKYLEARNAYFPTVVLGSGLAATYGFPMSIEGSAPSIIDLNSQQVLFNPAHREFVRAAQREWSAASVQTEDRQHQAALDAAVAYLDLARFESSLEPMRRQQQAAERLEWVVGERVREGVDSAAELTRARLAAARVRLRVAQLEGTADLVRQRLAHLTGLSEAALRIDRGSIPPFPETSQEEDLSARAVEASPAVRVAGERAAALEFRARGERRTMLPAVDLVGRYGLFSRHNNFDRFFQEFQRHNAVFGVSIRFPFLSPALRARADAAEAQVVSARREADGVKAEVSAEALRWQRAVRQAEAARDVARLELELARGAQARMDAGQLALREFERTRMEEQEIHLRALEADFELARVQMQLLRATGGLEEWLRAAR